MEKLSKKEWQDLYLYRMEPMTWWDHIRIYGINNGPIAPRLSTVMLIGDRRYDAEEWMYSNIECIKHLRQNYYMGYFSNQEEIAPEPYLFISATIDINLRGKRDYGWWYYVGHRQHDPGVTRLLRELSHSCYFNKEQPPYWDKGADAPCGYPSLKEYIDAKSRIKPAAIRRDRISGNTARSIIHDEFYRYPTGSQMDALEWIRKGG